MGVVIWPAVLHVAQCWGEKHESFCGGSFFYFCADVFRADLLILGLGASMYPLSPETKRHINSLGIRVEVQDTRNAAAQFNLLATERGVTEIAAALIPIGYGYKGRS